MKQYITVVLEYESAGAVPRMGFGTRDFGPFTRIAALQFDDAIEELTYLHDHCRPCDIEAAAAARRERPPTASGEQ